MPNLDLWSVSNKELFSKEREAWILETLIDSETMDLSGIYKVHMDFLPRQI